MNNIMESGLCIMYYMGTSVLVVRRKNYGRKNTYRR